MKYNNLAGFKTIDQYVNDKLTRLNKINHSFGDVYEMMFENESNIFFEESQGYRIKKITYGDAKRNVETIAKRIKAKFPGASYNSVIGLYLDNSHTWIEAFWAILKCGFRPLLLNMRLDEDVLEYSIDITNCVGVISNGKIFSVPALLENELYQEKEIEVSGDFGEEFFVMSSGTSNNVKICAYSAKEIINVLAQSKEIILSNKLIKKHYDGELKLLALLPFYHIFGFVAVYLWFAFYARTFVRLNNFNPVTVQNTIKRHHVTHIFAVPLFWQKTYDAAIKEIKNRGDKIYRKFEKGLKLSSKPVIGSLITKFAFKQVRDNLFGNSISFMITGGSMIDKKVLEFFNAIGYHLANGYGMSEIGITSVELTNDKKYLNNASIGKPLTGVRYQINDKGELSVKGDTIARRIIENKGVKKTEGEWFETHDLAKEIDGKYYLFGREDDLVISITGENLNPNIIEEKLLVENASNVCLINGKNGALPVLLVSINKFLIADKANELIKNLVTKIKENNLSSQIGKVVLIAEPFIKGEEFKMNRKRIESDYYDGKLAIYQPRKESSEDSDEISNKIKEYFAVALNKGVEDIASESDFFLDEGGTSLDYYVIVSQIQEDFGVNISDSSTPLNTVKDIATYIRENL